MHEVGIVLQLLDNVLSTAQAHHQTRVLDVYVQVGQLRAIEPDVMNFCWQTICQGSIAEGAKLHIETLSAKGYCEDCEKVFDATDLIFICSDCGGHRVKTQQGHELLLERVVMTDDLVDKNEVST